jgi:hypothetical protein
MLMSRTPSTCSTYTSAEKAKAHARSLGGSVVCGARGGAGRLRPQEQHRVRHVVRATVSGRAGTAASAGAVGAACAMRAGASCLRLHIDDASAARQLEPMSQLTTQPHYRRLCVLAVWTSRTLGVCAYRRCREERCDGYLPQGIVSSRAYPSSALAHGRGCGLMSSFALMLARLVARLQGCYRPIQTPGANAHQSRPSET